MKHNEKYVALKIQIHIPRSKVIVMPLWGTFVKLYHISSVFRQSMFIQKNLKNLDPSYKMDLDFLDCLGRLKLVTKQNFVELIYR